MRADVNTDPIAATMNLVGREHRVGRARSRPTATPAPTRANANPRQINDLSVPAEHALGSLAAKACGQSHSTTSSEAVDRAAHAERTTIEHMRVHHRRADVRVPEQLLRGPNVVPILEQVRRE